VDDRVAVMFDDKVEIFSGQCALTDSSRTTHPHAALEGSANNGGIPCLFNCWKVCFELL
jgi:hypothetical protein